MNAMYSADDVGVIFALRKHRSTLIIFFSVPTNGMIRAMGTTFFGPC